MRRSERSGYSLLEITDELKMGYEPAVRYLNGINDPILQKNKYGKFDIVPAIHIAEHLIGIQDERKKQIAENRLLRTMRKRPSAASRPGSLSSNTP